MDMMDINEGLMDLEFDFDAAHFQAIQATIKKFESDLYENVAEILEKPIIDKNDIKKVKDFYLKTRYLLRIKENLSKFAARL
jgi:molecular chaperone HscB